jgi:hypothetical protein
VLETENYHLHDILKHIQEEQAQADIATLLDSPVEAMDDQAIFDQAIRMEKLLGMSVKD